MNKTTLRMLYAWLIRLIFHKVARERETGPRIQVPNSWFKWYLKFKGSDVWSGVLKTEGNMRVLASIRYFCYKKDYCWPFVKTIAKETNLSVRTVQYSLRRLEALKLIEIKRQQCQAGDYTSNKYTLAADFFFFNSLHHPSNDCTTSKSQSVKKLCSVYEYPSTQKEKPSYDCKESLNKNREGVSVLLEYLRRSKVENVSRGTASRWIQRHPFNYITEKVDMIPWHRENGSEIENEAGWLARAIERDFKTKIMIEVEYERKRSQDIDRQMAEKRREDKELLKTFSKEQQEEEIKRYGKGAFL